VPASWAAGLSRGPTCGLTAFTSLSQPHFFGKEPHGVQLNKVPSTAGLPLIEVPKTNAGQSHRLAV